MPTVLDRTPTMVSQEDVVLGIVLSEGFRVHRDGWLYRGDPQAASVRCDVTSAGFHIQRRVRTGPWMPISSIRLDEFDASAFTQWAETWVPDTRV